MSGSENRDLQRLRYHQGQTFLSADLRDQQRIESRLRAWHNRALHNTFGVAQGLGAALAVSPGSTNNQVIVETGLAYDCFGRELLLQRRKTILFPPEVDEALLLIRHKDDRRIPRPIDLSGACLPESERLIDGEVEFIWKPAKSVTVRDGVPIARALPDSGAGSTLELDPDFTPPLSRPLARPRIAQGSTIPGATSWEVWRLSPRAGFTGGVAGLQVRIDTSSAGFTSTDDLSAPAYFASLQGPLTKLDNSKKIESGGVYLSHIDEISVDGFTFRFLIAVFNSQGGELKPAPDARAFLRQHEVYVSWLGISRG
ncbi:MAG TPA: hypothetical protein VFY40_23345 [Blastocatellia bacterium]|nr:hypothetical protein [Blastocatellia bacterium]